MLTLETNSLAREALITLKEDGLPPKSQWNDFMGQFALFGEDETSNVLAVNMLALIAYSDWNTLVPQVDSSELVLLEKQHSEDSARQESALLDNHTQDNRKRLKKDYGVILSEQEPDGSIGNGNWSDKAIASVLVAVQELAEALWTVESDLAGYATPRDAADLFQVVVGPVDIRLALEQESYFAITYGYDPDGRRDKSYNVIMFHEPGWENEGD